MVLKIDKNHVTFLLSSKIEEISANFFQNHGFNYFQYLRCFKDGSISILLNNTKLFEYFTKLKSEQPVVFSSIEGNQKSQFSYWFLWDEKLPKHPVNLAKEYNIHNGLTLVRRTKEYYDMIAVALPNHCDNAASFYINKLKVIENFVNQFDLNCKDLINVITKNPILLSTNYRDVNYREMCLSNNRINVNGRNGETYITTRELVCLRLLLQGASYKQIGKILEISDRTVETYISRIKQRTGFVSNSSLSPLIEICP